MRIHKHIYIYICTYIRIYIYRYYIFCGLPAGWEFMSLGHRYGLIQSVEYILLYSYHVYRSYTKKPPKKLKHIKILPYISVYLSVYIYMYIQIYTYLLLTAFSVIKIYISPCHAGSATGRARQFLLGSYSTWSWIHFKTSRCSRWGGLTCLTFLV